MPGSTTHSYILYSALRALEAQADSLFAPIVKSHVAAISRAMDDGFFADTNFSGNFVLNVSHYYKKTIPDEATSIFGKHLY